MENNILETDKATIIFNGGNPLEGCPKNYDEANAWADKANDERDKFTNPIWSFDCGFKLDFDGPILSVESRFYPPKTHYGPKWDGNTRINLLGKKITEKYFEAVTLDDLKTQVESYVKEQVRTLIRQ